VLYNKYALRLSSFVAAAQKKHGNDFAIPVFFFCERNFDILKFLQSEFLATFVFTQE